MGGARVRWFFGAHGQVALGAVVTIASIVVWFYGSTLEGKPLINLLFAVSMAAIVLGGYNLVATGLGYKATERVETAVVENIEHADQVVEK